MNKNGGLVNRFTSETSNERYWYIKLEGTDTWSSYLLKGHRSTADELELILRLGAMNLAKSIGRYVLPVEDIKIIIDGKDFDDQVASRYKAAGVLLLSIVPDSKGLKLTANIAEATVLATRVGRKTILLKGIKGLRAFTASNFSHNLSKITGKLPSNYQAHHVLPQKFRNYFERAGINIDNLIFGAWWKKTSHLNNASRYNSAWKSFF